MRLRIDRDWKATQPKAPWREVVESKVQRGFSGSTRYCTLSCGHTTREAKGRFNSFSTTPTPKRRRCADCLKAPQ